MTIVQREDEGVALAKEPIFDHLNYYPHVGQQKIHESDARHRVAACGRRFGKSVLGGNELVPEALFTSTLQEMLEEIGKRREFWIVGPEYSDSEKEFRVFWDSCKRLQLPMDKPGSYNNTNSGDMIVSLWGGRFIVTAKSAKYPETLVGEGLSGVILSEAAKLKESVWSKYIRPTLADFRGWSLSTSTPEGKNWFYEAYMRGLDPAKKSWASWRMPSWTNDVVFPDGAEDEEILDMKSEMTEEKFNQEVGADFSEYVGRVFKLFDEELHVKSLSYDKRYPVYACCDYGWTNPFVWLVLQVDTWDNIYVLAEYRAQYKDIEDIAEDLGNFPITNLITKFYPDPAEPGDTRILEKKLHIRAAGGGETGGELKWRLELIRKHLKMIPEHVPFSQRRPRLFIDRSCKELIREMNDYRYPETKTERNKAEPEKPLDKDDHGPEALGRFFRGYYGAPGANATGGRAKVRKANMGGAR